MTALYFIETRPHFDHSHPVHKKGCPLRPSEKKCKLLGPFKDGNDAVMEGLKHFHSVKGCLFCISNRPEWLKRDFGEGNAGKN
jgi:hypothetical protein